jgi:hypothetical protein
MATAKKEDKGKAGFFQDQYGKDGDKKPREKERKVNIDDISGPRKAAIVMVALGSEASSQIFRNLD